MPRQINHSTTKTMLHDTSAQKAGEEMLSFAKELFPLNRSIMGPDIRNSYKLFCLRHPEFNQLEFKTGESVFDWTVPNEWIIREAYIEHESGKRFAEFQCNNLHVMGYSAPVNTQMNKHDLLRKIHTHPFLLDAIPYVTSYYKEDWAFCLSENDVKKMPEGKYRVFIDSTLQPGRLTIQELVIKGRTDQELFFSSYLCHPSLANNELSGPVLLSKLIDYIQSLGGTHYSYRFVLLPETIGSIAYLSKRRIFLQERVICGFNLSCVGDERAFSHVASRKGDSLSDKALRAALQELENVNHYTFLHRGSDERQYCAPGIDLPISTFCRSKFGEYDEYHSSRDNFDVVTAKGLAGSFSVMTGIINAFELGLYPRVKVFGEPQLGKRGLYPLTSKLYNGQHPAELRMNIICQCDGRTSLFDISNYLSVNLMTIVDELDLLAKHGLIEFNSLSTYE